MFKSSDSLSHIALFFAGLCLLAAFWFAGTIVTGPTTSSLGLVTLQKQIVWDAPGNDRPGPYYMKPQNVIVIFPGKSGAEFNVPATKLPAGIAIAWVNKTGTPQTLIADDNNLTNITIMPGKPFALPLKEGGRPYNWHLASNPEAKITIFVGSNR